MFYQLGSNDGEPTDYRFRCACEAEYVPSKGRGYPSCRRQVPRVISVRDGPWVPFRQHKIDALKWILESGELRELPLLERKIVQESIEDKIRVMRMALGWLK